MKIMKKISLLVLGVLTASFLLSAPPGKSYLKRTILSIDSEEGLFKYGADIAIIDNDLYMVENTRHRIIDYTIGDTSLTYKRSVGRKGNGPGDIYLPIGISVLKDVIAVKDEIGISFFDKSGKYLDKFRLFSYNISFVFVNDHVYYLTSNLSSPGLIECFDKKGKLEKTFLKKFVDIDMKHHKKAPQNFIETLFYKGKLLSDGKYLYYFNSKFGKVFKFDLDGKSIFEKDITPLFGENGKLSVEKNTRAIDNGFEVVDGGYLSFPIFQDVRIYKGKIYILDFCPWAADDEKNTNKTTEQAIFVLNPNTLDLEKTYRIKLEEEDRLHCFAIREKKGKISFYCPMHTVDGTDIAEFKQ